ncbi:cell division protein ZapA [Oceanomicrobium pacificus]|uniref:Cell division protein ZapA n=1 Tax=Oceanomicrobium pacificus TaxID=2692916 RepID=A0A6B0TU83_9RHOB|nr:cell division protein ZapA [Oceanomicrobium pacificus]MXU66339.1 cell division protein ZapA [Oceanomicrobium pacificus]
MPELSLEIGGRSFSVVCEEGQETQLQAAAQLLDQEAQHVMGGLGRLPETRMLLMAGLMMADRAIGVAWKLESAEDRIGALEQRLKDAEAKLAVLQAKASEGPDDSRAEALLENLTGELEEFVDTMEQKGWVA